jgi:hypothetical protein
MYLGYPSDTVKFYNLVTVISAQEEQCVHIREENQESFYS